MSPNWFIVEQLAPRNTPLSNTFTKPIRSFLSPTKNGAAALLVSQQLGNAYLLLFMIGIAVLYTSTELKVVRNYLIVLLVADFGHMALTYSALLGQGAAADVSKWNSMTWGNVGAVIFLASTRIAYLAGLFGHDLPSRSRIKKLQ
jgi:hypothetical protein